MVLLAVLWLFSIKKKTPYSLLLLFPVCDQAGSVNSGHVAAPTFAQLPRWTCKLPALSKEVQSSPLFPIDFDECLIRTSLTQILLQMDHASSSQCKSQGDKLYRKCSPCTKTSVCFLSCLFAYFLLPFWLIFSFNCTLLSFSSASDRVICFTVSLDTWAICSLLLPPCSFPYSMSNHSISLKTLSSCSDVHFRSLEIFPCFFLVAYCYLSQFFLSHRKIWLGKFCSDVWEGELKVSGDKGLPPLVVRPGPLNVYDGETQKC